MNHALAGEGWKRIVERAMDAIIARCVAAGFSPNDVQILDIKEKYGTLRIHVSAPVETDDITDHAEAVSAFTCQICGEDGRQRGDRWISTLCDKHAREPA